MPTRRGPSTRRLQGETQVTGRLEPLFEILFQATVDNAMSIPLPPGVDHFTWSVVLNGIDVGEQAGLMLYNPPIIGASFDDFWQKDNILNTWDTFLLDGGQTPANFAAQITAVPEPCTLALSAFGTLALLGYFTLTR